jgi:hypothetical protein
MRNLLVLVMLLALMLVSSKVGAQGAIDNTSIGLTTPQAGKFTNLETDTLEATTSIKLGTETITSFDDIEDDNTVKSSATDSTAGFLQDELQAGTNVTISEVDIGGNKKVSVSVPNKLNNTGDLLVNNGSGETALPVGASGQFLTSDSSGALGWANPAEGGQLFNSNVLLNTYRTAENGNRSVLKIIDGVVDAFETETGVDATASTNESYTGNLYTSTRSGTPIQFVGLDAGLDNFLNRGGDLTGIADGKKGTVSFWFRPATLTGSQYILTNGGPERVTIRQNNAGLIVQLQDPLGAYILFLSSGGNGFEIGTFAHVFASWDLGANKANIYINGVDMTSGTPTILNKNIDYTAPNWKVGDRAGAANFLFKGDLGQLWFDTVYVDPSTDINKFYDNGSVELGSTGNLPTNSSPIIFLNNAFASWQNNLGTGGNFSVVGTPVDAGTVALGEADNLTLVSNSQTAKTSPTGANILVLAEGTIDLNNDDLKASVSKDGGTTFTVVDTLEEVGDFEDGKLYTGTVGLPAGSGTDMEWKVETQNNKLLNLHGVGLEWR